MKKIVAVLLVLLGFIVILFSFQSMAKAQLYDPDKGIAMAYYNADDIANTSAGWYHVWGVCNPSWVRGCVPMSYWGDPVPGLPTDYDGYILVFNEPDSYPPYGGTIDPQEAVIKYVQLRQVYPNAKFVVGNTIALSSNWLTEFDYMCNLYPNYGCQHPEVWGFHLYVGSAAHWQAYLEYFDNHYWTVEGDFWVTEFANIANDPDVLDQMLHYLGTSDWISRYAYFTNRAMGNEPWYPPGWGDVQMFDWDTGEITILGQIFADYSNYVPACPTQCVPGPGANCSDVVVTPCVQ